MADAVDPRILTQQGALLDSVPDLIETQAGGHELCARDDTVCGAGETCEFLFSCPILMGHCPT
jgi:hypothetical protein